MPGPCNLKKKRGNQAKKDKREKLRRAQRSSESATSSSPHGDKPEPVQWHDPDLETTPPSCRPTSLSPLEFSNANFERTTPNSSPDIPEGTPYVYIHDPGNGPRVRDTRAFLSSFFAHPPAIHDPLCAEFAQEEVLQMLVTILPEETALILWYNKSRVTGRICPACQRLYRLGDSLPDHFVDFEAKRSVRKTSPQLAREQKISGLCSPLCFILASFSNPSIIKSTWGRTAEWISDETWALLDANVRAHSGDSQNPGRGDHLGLSLLLKMTRLPDLGLAQLCLSEVDFGDEGSDEA